MNSSANQQPSARYTPPGWLVPACIAAILVGVAGMVLAFLTGPALDAWVWLLVWFVYFGGIANGMLAWAAILRTAQTRWAPAVNRLGHSALWFVPVQATALIVLLVGVRSYAPWVAHPIPEKAAWLNVPFMATREVVLLGGLWVLYALLVKWSLAADTRAARGEEIGAKEHYRLTSVAIAAVFVYCVTMTIVSYDFIMSLTPEWISTMFGPYYFCTSLYVAMAAMIVLAATVGPKLDAGRYLRPQQFHDMGNLLLGFGLFTMGLFFAQYLTIWYANLPMETEFLVVRYLNGDWPVVGWTAFILGYAIPFVVLQSRTLKRNRKWVGMAAVLPIIGVALERYVLVAPSLCPDKVAIAPMGALGSLAFGGAFVLTTVLFVARNPSVSSADVALGSLPPPERAEQRP